MLLNWIGSVSSAIFHFFLAFLFCDFHYFPLYPSLLKQIRQLKKLSRQIEVYTELEPLRHRVLQLIYVLPELNNR